MQLKPFEQFLKDKMISSSVMFIVDHTFILRTEKSHKHWHLNAEHKLGHDLIVLGYQ